MSERPTARKIHVIDVARLRVREQPYRSDDTGQVTSPWSSTECSCCGQQHRK
jgi:hypothetical protein